MTRNLNECLTSHPECMVAQASEWLPTRLLDLRFARGEKGTVSIIEKEDIAVPSQYLTLSHVWGSTSKPLQLTLDNYARMKTAGIPVHSMPLCYREVIQIAENLKMRYLWIDSLWSVFGSVSLKSSSQPNSFQQYHSGLSKGLGQRGPHHGSNIQQRTMQHCRM